MRSFLIQAALFLSLFIFPSTGWCWLVTPNTETVSPEKPQTTFKIISNGDKTESAIEIYVADRIIDEQGNEKEVKNQKDFFIFPSHMILKPNQKRIVRVIWKGNPAIKEEKAYRLAVESLPVDFLKNEDKEKKVTVNIKLAVRCLCSLYVCPKDAKENIQCVSAIFKETGGVKSVLAEFKNLGTKHGLLKDRGITIQSGGKKSQLSKEQVSEITNAAYNVLALNTRVLLLPLPESFQATDPISISLE
jgi:P pilus assembly chaperone PapD